MTLLEYDKAQGVELLCGVDEAGRGPLAGDVYAAAVILPPDCEIAGLNDSKKLSEKKREALFDEICEKAVSYCIATASIEEIERLNILQATFLAMNRAVAGLTVQPKLVLVDGNKNPIKGINSRALVKGDATSASIAAASILAKVARDRYMQSIDATYPEYCFSKHKGYGTKLHYEMLDKYGPSPAHRMSFLKKYFDAKQTAPKPEKTGDMGEKLACKYLKKHGCKILDTNYSTKAGEIDIVAADGDTIVFAEVKTRAPDALYAPAEAVDRKKQARIVKAALAYLRQKGMTDRQIRFDVLEVTMNGSKPDLRAVHHIVNAFSGEGQHVYL